MPPRHDSALGRLSEAGYDPAYGSRRLKCAIQQQMENPLAQAILSGKFSPGERVRGSVRDRVPAFRH